MPCAHTLTSLRQPSRPNPQGTHRILLSQDTGDHDVAFLASFADPKLIFEQLAVMYAMPRMRARHFRVIVPYFSTGTMAQPILS